MNDTATPPPQPQAPPPDATQPPQQTPAPEPTQPPPGAPQLSVDTLTEAMVRAYRTAVPAAPMTAPPQARDWMETLSQAQRDELQQLALTDPLRAARIVSEQSGNFMRQQILSEAAPLVQSQARTIVEMYKQRKVLNDPLGSDTAAIFDQMLATVDLRPLVNMNPSQQAHELDMRWDAAYGQVVRKRPAPTAPRPDPTLLAQNQGGTPPGRKIDADPALARMAQEYGFTPAQIAEIEESM